MRRLPPSRCGKATRLRGRRRSLHDATSPEPTPRCPLDQQIGKSDTPFRINRRPRSHAPPLQLSSRCLSPGPMSRLAQAVPKGRRLGGEGGPETANPYWRDLLILCTDPRRRKLTTSRQAERWLLGTSARMPVVSRAPLTTHPRYPHPRDPPHNPCQPSPSGTHASWVCRGAVVSVGKSGTHQLDR